MQAARIMDLVRTYGQMECISNIPWMAAWANHDNTDRHSQGWLAGMADARPRPHWARDIPKPLGFVRILAFGGSIPPLAPLASLGPVYW